MHTVDIVVASMAALALLMAVVAHGLRLRWLNAPVVALVIGVLIGPEGFGPAGVGALFFAAVAHKETHNEYVWAVTTLLVAATIVLHDLTATPFSQWLGRHVADDQRE